MNWQELGYSTGKVSLKTLLEGGLIDVYDEATDLEFIIEKIITGGFPGLINKSLQQATDTNCAYIDLLDEVDMSRVSDIKEILSR